MQKNYKNLLRNLKITINELYLQRRYKYFKHIKLLFRFLKDNGLFETFRKEFEKNNSIVVEGNLGKYAFIKKINGKLKESKYKTFKIHDLYII